MLIFYDNTFVYCYIANKRCFFQLDYKVDKKKLKEIFRLAGRVQRVDLSLDKDGKSRGFAVVEYDHPVEAVQSISMFHNQMLYDRQMTVRMDREGDRAGLKLPDGLKGIGMGLGSNGEPLKEVARNLPSITNNPPQPQAVGSGILGAVPNAGLGALNLNSALGTSALNSLSNNAAALQAAALGGLSTNLLASSLGGGDLGLANLVQNQSLAALASSNATGNTAAFARNDNPGPFGNQTANSGFGNTNRNFEDSKPNRPFNYNDRNEGIFNNASNGQMHRGAKANFGNTKILISNVSYQ